MFKVESATPIKPYEVTLRELKIGDDFRLIGGTKVWYKTAEDDLSALIRNRHDSSDVSYIRLHAKVIPLKYQYDVKPVASVTLSAVVKLIPGGDAYLKVASTFLYNIKNGDLITVTPETMIYLIGRLHEDKQ